MNQPWIYMYSPCRPHLPFSDLFIGFWSCFINPVSSPGVLKSFLLTSGCHNKISYTEWLQQQKFISHSPRDLKVEDQDAGKVGFIVRLFALYVAIILLCAP
ncbi:unnamed protein product [Rangifer tarandus platyrhynchus]|uniref:Uncharacterized protein n=2 Tax=Rangifer tarandus platyrhynchus TaxID=3082113 RepID=A0AC59ZX34_RANTA|nr:unnamed protein product [Rangifer tarandus platyrhynchus]